jgi:alpha-tubulin suppressor-like RCC1 family protein
MRYLRAVHVLACTFIASACIPKADPFGGGGLGGSDESGGSDSGGSDSGGSSSGGSSSGGSSAGGSSSGGSGGTGGEPGECAEASDCPAPAIECEVAVCVAGVCGAAPAAPEASCGLPLGNAGVCDGEGTCGECVPAAVHCQNDDTVEACGADWFWSGDGEGCPAICSEGACMPAVEIAAGEHHNCARFPDGHVRCWGRNDSGQLGNGTMSAQGVDPPVVATPLFEITALFLGGRTSFAIDDDHKVLAWGDNSTGQLGLGDTTNRATPDDIPLAFGATTLAVSHGNVCAVMGDATVSCWGDNADGLLGTNDGSAVVTSPSAVAGLTGVVDVAAGLGHRCALLGDATVACWGQNDVGQLGLGSDGAGSATPTVVPGLGGVVSIDIGGAGKHTCAALTDGSVKCWGDNDNGQLGLDTFGGHVSTPTATALSFSGVYRVVLGSHHSCARSNVSANVYCWGANGSGQLGLGHNGDVAFPHALNHTGVAGVALGGGSASASGHSCTLNDGGSIACAGDNLWRQLSDAAYSGVFSNTFYKVSFWHDDFLGPSGP